MGTDDKTKGAAVMITTYYKIRCVNGEFWRITEDELERDEEFDTLHEVRNAIAEFLGDAEEADMDYTVGDIEVVEFSIVEKEVSAEELWR